MDSPVSPAPRLIARSMLSLGTEVFLAFCTASTSVGLPERSAPPSFAATSMFLMSFANDLARRESMIAFLCLVVAHLECPDIKLLRPVCAHAGRGSRWLPQCRRGTQPRAIPVLKVW